MREITNESEALKFLQDQRNEFERKLGSLRAGQGAKNITLPLDSVDIKANVIGRVTEVTITQVFKNPYKEHLEAEYIFPLAGCSSVNGFKMIVAGRTVVGTIQERRAARQEYQRALSEGKRASLLEQERDDVFTMQVGNIPPNEKITVELTYTEKLEFFEDGTTELRLPLVVAPRYAPGNPLAREQVGDGVGGDTDVVPDASRVTPPRLAEGLDPGVSLSISVELIPQQSACRDWQNQRISDLSCSQHAVKTHTGNGVIMVTLAKANELLNRDFVLKWRLVSDVMASSVVLTKSAKNEYFGMLSLLPPAKAAVKQIPRDVVFLLDRSGSMMGAKMASASKACSILLESLGPKDRFAINAFDHVCEWFNPDRSNVNVLDMFEADVAGIEAGSKFLRTVTARGGTELHDALRESLDLVNANSEKNRVGVIVILTDGQVSNEAQVFKLAQQYAKDTRIFTVGIDTVVNCPMLMRLSALAGGTSTCVVPGVQLEDALIEIGREIGAPLVTDLTVECLTEGVRIEQMAPGRVRDLFVGRTSDCLFRIETDDPKIAEKKLQNAKFRVRGKLPNGRKYSEELVCQTVDMPSVSRLWARDYIKELEDEFRTQAVNQNEIKQEIIDLSVAFSVLTKFTAFVAVDEEEIVNNSDEIRQVVQPVHNPDQWDLQQTGGFPLATPGQAPGISPSFFNQGTTGGAGSYGCGMFGIAESFGASNAYGAAKPADASGAKDSWSSGYWGAVDANALSEKSGVSDPNWIAFQTRARGETSSNSNVGGSTPAAGGFPASAGGSAPTSGSSTPGSSTPGSSGPASSAWSTLKKLFKGSSEKVQTSNGKLIDRVINALAAFRDAWVASWVEVGKGGLPEADKIELARKELVEALADHPVGFEVPLLQKFLRTSAIEYVAALRASDASAWAIYKSRSRFHEGFVDAMVEAEVAAATVQGRQGAFWESNV